MSISDALLQRSSWNDDELATDGVEVVDAPFATVGGGLGSFAMVDMLRVAGVDTEHIAVLGALESPSSTYEYLAGNSQIPPQERLRSDSGSVMDNVWGWPGYALREAVSERTLRPAWQALTEPILTEYYTPRAGQVYASVAREAQRIGWSSMLRPGVVRTVRRRTGGGYFVLHTPAGQAEPSAGRPVRRVAYRCRHVHVAVGYPGVKLLPDLQVYREQHQDWARVVNAYEPHDHVYEECRRRRCTVVVRGAGIVASRVLQRIIDDRDAHGAQTRIVHLFRSYPDGPQGDRITFRRPARKGWSYQAFNYPKAAWGGQLRDRLDRLEGPERAALIDEMGGTNTAPRRDWQDQLERGEREGFYRQLLGTVSVVEPTGDAAGVRTTVRAPEGDPITFDADFIVDATGLEADIEEHRVLADLLRYGGARKNPKGRLDVERDFVVRGTESGDGRLYASGSITLGGYYAGVDSFLGLQYASLRIADSLASQGFGTRIGPVRSVTQWWRWARNLPA